MPNKNTTAAQVDIVEIDGIKMSQAEAFVYLQKQREEANVRLAEAQAERDAAIAAKNAPREIGLIVGPKGGITVTGVGRYGSTAYADQWCKILQLVDSGKFVAFMRQSLLDGKLTFKDGDAGVQARKEVTDYLATKQ